FTPRPLAAQALLHLVPGAGEYEGRADRLPRGGRRVGQQRLIGRVMLTLIEVGQRADDALKGRIVRHVAHQLTVDVDMTAVPQSVDIRFPGSYTHDSGSPYVAIQRAQ